MKIALVHNLPPGGAKRALYEHARHLRERGHTLDAYVLSTAAEEYLPLKPLCRDLHRYEAGPIPARGGPRLLRLLLSSPVWRGLGRYGCVFAADGLKVEAMHRELSAVEQAYARVARDINAGAYDLVYVHHCRVSLSPALLRELNLPSVYYCQDTLRNVYEWLPDEQPDYDRRRESLYVRKRRGATFTLATLRFLQRQEQQYVANTRAATVVLANSWYSREAIARTTGVNAHVCYLGVDSEFFCPDPSVGRENLVLSVGALLPSKRHDFVLNAIACLPKTRRPRMQIIGYEMEIGYGKTALGPQAKKLLRLAEEKGVDLAIDKEVSDPMLRDSYRRASVVAFAPYLEPFGFVPLEAMACGTPVVGVSEGGLRETIQDGITGLLTGRDASEFAAALDRLLADKGLATEIGKNGRDAAIQRWTWRRSMDTLEQYFDRALHQK